MDKLKLNYSNKMINITLEDNRLLSFAPDDLWNIVENCYRFILDNYKNISPRPIKIVQKNGKFFNIVISDQINFWYDMEKDLREPNTYKIFDYFISEDCIYFDIGAWIGPTVLYAAQLAKESFAFEPDPIAFKELSLNIAANNNREWISRITIFNKAVTTSKGRFFLGNRYSGGDSTSSLLYSDQDNKWEVEGVTLDDFILPKITKGDNIFLKIDIEGGEYQLIPYLIKFFHYPNIDLLLSIHPRILLFNLQKINKVLKIYKYIYNHIKLIKALPFNFFYNVHGQQINKLKFIVYVICAGIFCPGNFSIELLATNRRWYNDQ